jgi:hypothetical protein
MNFQPPPDFAASEEAIAAFAVITIAYLVLVVLVTLSSRFHDLRLIGLGLLTAVASVGYMSLVSGGAIVAGPVLMKIAVLLILGGLATRLLQTNESRTTIASGEPTHV